MKKVLISLDELKEMMSDSFLRGLKHEDRYCPEPGIFVTDWFDAQPAAPQWVLIGMSYGEPTGELPNNGDEVLIRFWDDRFTEKIAAIYSKDTQGERFYSAGKFYTLYQVSHWMPIPPLADSLSKEEEWICGGGPITQGLEVNEYYRKHKKVKDEA